MGKPKDQGWESWIDQQIREAQERGAFDNLPGKGKPLELGANPHAGEQEIAFRILKDTGCAPEWIELDKAIRGRLDRARAVLARQWEWYRARMQAMAGRDDAWAGAERERAAAGWQTAVESFGEEVQGINREIGELNLKVPGPRFQRSKIDAGREIEELRRARSETVAHQDDPQRGKHEPGG